MCVYSCGKNDIEQRTKTDCIIIGLGWKVSYKVEMALNPTSAVILQMCRTLQSDIFLVRIVICIKCKCRWKFT